MFFGICHHYSHHYIRRSRPGYTLNRSNTTPYTRKTPCPMSYHISCKNVQKTTYTIIHTVILYYYGMFFVWGIFTFSETAVFPPGMGCVQLTRQLKNSTYPFPPISTTFLPILPISHPIS